MLLGVFVGPDTYMQGRKKYFRENKNKLAFYIIYQNSDRTDGWFSFSWKTSTRFSPSQCKDRLSHGWDSDVKDKTVVRPPYL